MSINLVMTDRIYRYIYMCYIVHNTIFSSFKFAIFSLYTVTVYNVVTVTV